MSKDDLQLLQLSDRSDRFASLGMNLAVVARVASTTDSETAGMLTECFVGKEDWSKGILDFAMFVKQTPSHCRRVMPCRAWSRTSPLPAWYLS